VLLDGPGEVLPEAGVEEVVVVPYLKARFGEEVGEILFQIRIDGLKTGSGFVPGKGVGLGSGLSSGSASLGSGPSVDDLRRFTCLHCLVPHLHRSGRPSLDVTRYHTSRIPLSFKNCRSPNDPSYAR